MGIVACIPTVKFSLVTLYLVGLFYNKTGVIDIWS